MLTGRKRLALLKESFDAALPSDVRKASGLPASSILKLGLSPAFGAQPRIVVPFNRSAERFRTSDGIAESPFANFLGRAKRLISWKDSA